MTQTGDKFDKYFEDPGIMESDFVLNDHLGYGVAIHSLSAAFAHSWQQNAIVLWLGTSFAPLHNRRWNIYSPKHTGDKGVVEIMDFSGQIVAGEDQGGSIMQQI